MEQHPVIALQDISIYHTRDSLRTANPKRLQRDGDLVLSDISLEVMPGELVYLIGRVGSGKSSLLKIIYGELPLCEGRGWVAGYDLRRLRPKEVPLLRRRLGIVFQDYQLLTDRNVYQNLRFVLRSIGWREESAMRERIAEVLHQVGLHHKEYKMPFQLSGGEQQRLSIARALLNRPLVILADEPTGNLDPAAADGIMQLFRSIAGEGCAVLMATHNIGNIQQYPSRTLRFNTGKVEEIDIVSILGC